MDRVIQKKSFLKLHWKWIASVMLIFGCSAYWISGTSAKTFEVEMNHLTVDTVSIGPFVEYIPLNGVVEPIRSIYIETTEGGKVEEIFVEDGIDILSGTPIIRLVNQQFQMDAINRESQLMDQQNNLRNARLQMDQQTTSLKAEELQSRFSLQESERTVRINEKLFADHAISVMEYERSKDQLQLQKSSRKLIFEKLKMDSVYRLNQSGQIESSLRLIQDNLEFLHRSMESLIVKAPITGVLSQIQVELGQTVSPGARIAQIDVMDDLKITTQIAEQYSARVSPGQSAVFVMNGTSYSAEVIKVYPEIINGHFSVDLKFVGEVPSSIRRGQTLQLKLALGNEAEAIQIPRGAFFQSTGGSEIFVLSAPDKAEKRKIKLARQNADYYEVVEGLNPGELVITSSYDIFNNVEQLRITEK